MTDATPAPAEALSLIAAWMAAQTASETGSRDAEETAGLLLDRLFTEFTPDTLRGLAARAEAAEARVRELEEAARGLIATYEGPEEFPGYIPMVRACWPALRALEAALAGSPS